MLADWARGPWSLFTNLLREYEKNTAECLTTPGEYDNNGSLGRGEISADYGQNSGPTGAFP